ncbi:vesicle-associated membrane [Histomonas meleagridis]|uniref:vesicle-associated membrane n=1 Tax=Histomonas meleagridis TaxID=135588 RepID=UPI0035594830|nr:vesicle-associated membrane [Histomonas meleagridis]KAH0805661.1 vesicle-associated membrane [Histomonas meleagridis]
MEFCYAAVMRNDVPLVQHCPRPGNFDLFFQKYSEKNKISVGKTIVISEDFYWGILAMEGGLTFLCVVRGVSDQEILDKALEDLKNRFLRVHGNEWKNARPFAFQTSFEQQLVSVKKSLLAISQVKESMNNSKNQQVEPSLLMQEFDSMNLSEVPLENVGQNKFKTVFLIIAIVIVASLFIVAVVIAIRN